MSTATTHVLAYPFPTSGHVIPLLDFTKTLVSRGVHVTVLVTPYNEALLPKNYSPLLQTLLLPEPQFPNPKQNRLVSMVTFMRHHHYPIIMDWAQAQPIPPAAIISDFFLGWTHLLARDLHVSRFVFSPFGTFALSVSYSLWRDSPKTTTQKTQTPSFFFKTSRTPQSTPGGRLRTYFVTLREEVPNGSLTERTCFSTSTLGASFSTHSSSWNEFT